ncbi:uncharacterized protein LOC126553668 [Aphis gossypii]|uniref:uncharacterized protein LOC126553668 n=1 Tax=Aphis gossypii TaxID=80765 RepID=UPI002158E958|nr:uncharacterized protein LOC126553668 [Aphis gossypii]
MQWNNDCLTDAIQSELFIRMRAGRAVLIAGKKHPDHSNDGPGRRLASGPRFVARAAAYQHRHASGDPRHRLAGGDPRRRHHNGGPGPDREVGARRWRTVWPLWSSTTEKRMSKQINNKI